MKKDRRRLKKRELNKMVGIGRVAARLFKEKGYLRTRMEDIATASRLSKGGIFHYFSTKDEILYFILNNYMDLILEGLEQELDRIGDNLSKINFIISRHIDLYNKNLAESKTLLHDAYNLPSKYYKVIAVKERKYYRIVANVISDLAGKRLPKRQLTAITFSLFGMCNWIYSWYNPKGSLTPNELSEIIYEVFSRGCARH